VEEGAKADPSAALRDDKPIIGAVHVLDDGFQHRRLGRDLDLALLTVEDARDWLLPAGNLREGLGALGRADVVVVREDEAEALRRVIPAGKEVWVVRRELELPVATPKRLVAFCGIARPEGFLGMLAGAGREAAGRVVFPDHYAYAEEDFARLAEAARHAGADGFVTTAKDAVKISAAGRLALEEVGPVVVAELRVSLADEDAAWRTIQRLLP
jgi:tetraacyldisaccharide 4'-kinase